MNAPSAHRNDGRGVDAHALAPHPQPSHPRKKALGLIEGAGRLTLEQIVTTAAEQTGATGVAGDVAIFERVDR